MGDIKQLYSMIIVDDEEGICKGLRDLDWNSLRIEVKGIFSNGLAAYQYIMEEAVDIVLTDIKMPIIDGLELSKMLDEEFPQIIKVILSGYPDFEYAKRCMEYHVRNFLLKPISWRELETIFKGLIIELDAIQIEKEKQEKIIARDVKAQKIIREDFKRALIKGKITDIELEQGAALEHFALDSKGYRAAVIRLDREKAKFTERNWELISICLETSAKNFFEGENCWHIFVDRERNFLYLICTDEIESADDARMIKRMKQLKNKIYTQRALLDSTISAAIGSFQRTPQELCLSATVAVELLGRSVDNNLTVCYNKEDEVRQGVFLVNRAILFIRDNYSRPITLKEVAEHIFLHPSYLSSLFRQVTGKRFVDYLTDYRMEQAKQMLADPKYKINEIANLCGYESHKYFSAVFRERMGMTPSEYRRNL